jgi:hypothetical protein
MVTMLQQVDLGVHGSITGTAGYAQELVSPQIRHFTSFSCPYLLRGLPSFPQLYRQPQ